jgi:hypothetical protein
MGGKNDHIAWSVDFDLFQTEKYWDETMKWLRKTLEASFEKIPFGSLCRNICKHQKIGKGVEKYPFRPCLTKTSTQKSNMTWKKPKIGR